MIGQIYCIKSPQTTETYVGSTTRGLDIRMKEHTIAYGLYQNDMYSYVSSFDIVKYPDAYIELLEERTFETKEDRYKCEGKWMKELNSCNKQIAGRDRYEWYNDNREIVLGKMKIYRDKNKKELNRKDREFYLANKLQINQLQKERIACECGAIVSRSNIARHIKNKH